MQTANPNPPQLPPWSEIEANCRTNGMPAYLSALKTVYDAVSRLIEQTTTAPNPSSNGNSHLPGSIPESGVIHAPVTSGPYVMLTLEEYAAYVRDQNALASLFGGVK